MGGSWGKAHIILSLFHDRTDIHCTHAQCVIHCRCSLSHTSIFIADPGAPMKACSDCCAGRHRSCRSAVSDEGPKLTSSWGPSQPLPGSSKLLPQGRVVVVHRVLWVGQVLADVPVPSPDPDPDVSGKWVGSDRGQDIKKTPADLATRPGAVRPGRSS